MVVLALPDLEPDIADLRPTEECSAPEVISAEDRSEFRFGSMKEDEGRKERVFLAFGHQMKWSVRFRITTRIWTPIVIVPCSMPNRDLSSVSR